MDLSSKLLLCFMCLVPVFSNGQSAEKLVDQGHRYYELGDYIEAISALNKASKLDATNPEIYYLLGVCKSQLQYNDEALIDYEIALKLDSNYAEVHFERGYSYFMTGKLEEAIESYNQAIALQPKNAIAYVNRGSVKCILGDKEGAMADWKIAEKFGAPLPDQECDI